MAATVTFYNYANIAMPIIGNPTSWISAGDTNLALGTSGDDVLFGNGHATLIGNGGNDLFYIYGHADQVLNSAGGTATVVASCMSYALPDTVKNLGISTEYTAASEYSGTGTGNSLDNLLVALGTGNVRLDGADGDDVLVGNSGVNHFVASKGNDVIYNFDLATDVIDVNLTYTNFDSLSKVMTQVGNDVFVPLGSTASVTIRNTQVASLAASNFTFNLDYSKYRMTFNDEFTSFSSSPDGLTGRWMTSYPFGGLGARTLPDNHENEFYSDSSTGVNPFSVKDGLLTITAAPATTGQVPEGFGLTYTSGLITTYRSFSQLYGYFEVRADLPSGTGFWPAFWLLPTSGTWPPELDVFEQLGGDPSTIYSTAHTSGSGFYTSTKFETQVPTASTGFHTYGVDWQPETITWYIDGSPIGSMPTPADFHQPMYMLLNLAVGGNWGGPADGISSGTYVIDYVRAYTRESNPILTVQTAPQTWTLGQAVNFTLAPNTFTDPEGEKLTYSATQANGSALPSWLTFNAATGTFTGTPPAGTSGLSIRVTATNESGLSTSETFAVQTPLPTPPIVTAQTPTQTWKLGQAVDFTLASNTFTDPDGEKLTYSATQANGSALPSWLTFDSETCTFTGTVPNTATGLSIKVTATDAGGASTFETFSVLTPGSAPVVTAQTADQTWTAGKAIRLALPTNTFTDPDGEKLTYSATQADGSALPKWLSFNATTETFTGRTPTKPLTLSVTVKATDTSGLSASETFAISIAAAASTLVQGISSLGRSGGWGNVALSHPLSVNSPTLSSPF